MWYRKGHGVKLEVLKRLKHPPGDDFFLVSFVVNSSDPFFDKRQSFMGPWNVIMNTLALFELPRDTDVLFLQGDRAREYVARSAYDEVRYRKDRMSRMAKDRN
jgi:hypothetical protein